MSKHLPDMAIPSERERGKRGTRSSGGGGSSSSYGGWGEDDARPMPAVLGDLDWDLGEEPEVLVWDGDGVGGVELPNPCPETRPICLQVRAVALSWSLWRFVVLFWAISLLFPWFVLCSVFSFACSVAWLCVLLCSLVFRFPCLVCVLLFSCFLLFLRVFFDQYLLPTISYSFRFGFRLSCLILCFVAAFFLFLVLFLAIKELHTLLTAILVPAKPAFTDGMAGFVERCVMPGMPLQHVATTPENTEKNASAYNTTTALLDLPSAAVK